MFRMDKIMKKLFYILSAAVVMATACVRESVPEQEQEPILTTTVAPQEGDMMLVTFALSIPDAELLATQTRAQTFDNTPEQPNVGANEVYVAVFGGGSTEARGGNLQNFVKAEIVYDPQTYLNPPISHNLDGVFGSTPTGQGNFLYLYNVLLPLSSEPLVLDFMVGACDADGVPYTLDHPLPVGYEEEVMEQVYSMNRVCGFWQRKRISGVTPKMVNGQYVLTTYKGSNGRTLPAQNQDYIADEIPELEEVILVRNFAKISFWSKEECPFMIHGFILVDTPKTGSIAPYSEAQGYNTAYIDPRRSTAAAILGSYSGHELSYELTSGLPNGVTDYSGWVTKWDPGQNMCYDYMYERTIPTNSEPAFAETGAILKVTWTKVYLLDDPKLQQELWGNPNRYYKVSLVDENGAYIPILRNFRYVFEVSDITTDHHPKTADEAYRGEFLGDVSASVRTSMLDDLSNTKSRIVVAGRSGNNMSYTSIGTGKSFNVDFYFYPNANNSEVVVTNGKNSRAGKRVSIQTDIETNGSYPQAIASISDVVVTHNSNGTDNHGTITVTLNDSQPGIVQKGKLKILGQVEGARALYREVEFTVMEKQEFAAGDVQTTVTPLSSDSMNQETTVTIALPDGLPRDMFPLQIKIEAQNNGLTSIPDKTVEPNISALPVKYGPSAFNGDKNSYYFVKTITFDDYATLNGTSYEYTNEFPCKFKTRLSSGNATTIKINDLNEEYFQEKTIQLTAN
jgi:hypothetical protein